MKTKFILLTAILALTLAACGTAAPTPQATALPTVMADTSIISEGRLEPIRYVEVALNASGLVAEVFVKEGDTVTAGQVIARLESSEAKTLEDAIVDATQELTAAHQAVRDAQFKLDNFDVPSDFKDMTPEQAVEMTLENLNKARADFEPYKDLNERSLELTAAEKESGNPQGLAKTYKRRLDDAWAKYRKAILWMELTTNLETAQARLAQAQKEYDALHDPAFTEDTVGLRAALANAEVRAPFAGVITNLKLKVGEFASAGTPVVTIADLSKWVIKTTDLTEIDVVNLKDGQLATVTLDALPGVTLDGNIFSIGQEYSENQGDVVYEVTILLTEADPAMRWGMTAEVKFDR